MCDRMLGDRLVREALRAVAKLAWLAVAAAPASTTASPPPAAFAFALARLAGFRFGDGVFLGAALSIAFACRFDFLLDEERDLPGALRQGASGFDRVHLFTAIDH